MWTHLRPLGVVRTAGVDEAAAGEVRGRDGGRETDDGIEQR